jgi:hypothetical protein
MEVMTVYGRRREFLILQVAVNDVDLLETGNQHENSWATYP